MSDAEALRSLAENHYNAIGYDAWAMLRDIASHIESLEKENAALREKSRILAGRIGCGCGGDYGLCDECSSALDAPPTIDKGDEG